MNDTAARPKYMSSVSGLCPHACHLNPPSLSALLLLCLPPAGLHPMPRGARIAPAAHQVLYLCDGSGGLVAGCWNRCPGGESLLGHSHCSSEEQEEGQMTLVLLTVRGNHSICCHTLPALSGLLRGLLVATRDHPHALCLPWALPCLLHP